MHRRAFLGGLGAAGLGGVAGCLGGVAGLADANPNVTLPEPDRQFDSADVAYPAWGERIPDIMLPAPLSDASVSLHAVETPAVFTFFYSYCGTVCPALVSTLRNVQAHAASAGYADAVAFYPITFDPARDDADRLRAYAERMNVDTDAGNWQFLRPSTPERAAAVVGDAFGVTFQKDAEMDEGAGGGEGHDHHEGYGFVHTSLVLLVNADGYVERAYRGTSPSSSAVIDDLERLR